MWQYVYSLVLLSCVRSPFDSDLFDSILKRCTCDALVHLLLSCSTRRSTTVAFVQLFVWDGSNHSSCEEATQNFSFALRVLKKMQTETHSSKSSYFIKTYATFYQLRTAMSGFSRKQAMLQEINWIVFNPQIPRLNCYYMPMLTCETLWCAQNSPVKHFTIDIKNLLIAGHSFICSWKILANNYIFSQFA